MPADANRLLALRDHAEQFTGIDFVRVQDACDQRLLRVYFLTDIRELQPPFATASGNPASPLPLAPDDVVIHSATDAAEPPIRLAGPPSVGFDDELQRSYLEVEVVAPGNFSTYRLRIDDPQSSGDPFQAPFSRVDPFFNDVAFSFKSGCEDLLDCQPVAPACPVEEEVDFPVDYLARDFVSLRGALLDFAAQRYPQWTQPLEADVGTMLTEVMAAVGDELSFIQDRYAREAFLATATERRSLRKKARLMDFEIHDGRAANTWLELEVAGAGSVPAGTRFWSLSEGGAPIPFEVGTSLADMRFDDPGSGAVSFATDPRWNAGEREPYWLSDETQCLQAGATELLFSGSAQGTADLIGRRLLLKTTPDDPSIPARRHLVSIESVVEQTDPLFAQPITRVRWAAADALPFQIDQALLQLSFNVLPAVAGETRTLTLVVASDPNAPSAAAVTVRRQGALPFGSAQRPIVHLFGLPETETSGLGFVGAELRATTPEVVVLENGTDPWTWRRSLLEVGDRDQAFALEDGSWRRVVGYRRTGDEIVHRDYASGRGFSLRFGDGVFGRAPDPGTSFTLHYRLGPGARANVPAGAITAFQVAGGTSNVPAFVTSATNPLPVTSGVDPESAREIRQLTPEAYQAEVLFALREADYGKQAERLDFVQRARGANRWTGSWTTTFVAADPLGAFSLTDDQRDDLENLMDCVRQAGHDVIVRPPDTIGLDLVITLCVEKTAYAAQVRALVEQVLLGVRSGRTLAGFFSPDNFTFGTPLKRSALEAAILAVPGVRSVLGMSVRLRGQGGLRPFRELVLSIDANQVFRLENDPARPANGTLTLLTQGGA